MKKRCFIVLFSTLMYTSSLYAQSPLPNKQIQLSGGYSRHGSGDLNGIIFGTEFVKYKSKKFSMSYNLRATINDGQETIIVNDLISGIRTDNSIHFTTAGVQVGADAGYSLLRNMRHEVKLTLGAFGRYQSASPPAGYALYMPNRTNVPAVLVEFLNFSDQPRRTMAFGGVFQLQYNYTFKQNLGFGISSGFQTDTNGDALPFAMLQLGKRF